LAYVNQLVNSGNTSHAHTSAYLQTLIKQESPPTKTDNNQKNTPLLIGGLVVFGVFILGIGYL
jgi:hypothetical protein